MKNKKQKSTTTTGKHPALIERINAFDKNAPGEMRGYYTMRGVCLAYVQLVHNVDDKDVIFKAFNTFAQNCVISFDEDSYGVMKYCFLELCVSFREIDPQIISDKTLNALRDEPLLVEVYLEFFSDIIEQTRIQRELRTKIRQ